MSCVSGCVYSTVEAVFCRVSGVNQSECKRVRAEAEGTSRHGPGVLCGAFTNARPTPRSLFSQRRARRPCRYAGLGRPSSRAREGMRKDPPLGENRPTKSPVSGHIKGVSRAFLGRAAVLSVCARECSPSIRAWKRHRSRRPFGPRTSTPLPAAPPTSRTSSRCSRTTRRPSGMSSLLKRSEAWPGGQRGARRRWRGCPAGAYARDCLLARAGRPLRAPCGPDMPRSLSTP